MVDADKTNRQTTLLRQRQQAPSSWGADAQKSMGGYWIFFEIWGTCRPWTAERLIKFLKVMNLGLGWGSE